MAFKSIPVVAAKVTGSHSNFPVLVKPSVITGLGSLTTAEANSARFYSDSAKTTELAREIVSSDQIWVKVPSLTTTTTIYIDYDGSRADYAVTDTYGRNAVWSAYQYVYHLEAVTDSTGNTNLTGSGSISAGDVAGKIGQGTNFDASNDFFTGGGADPTSALTIQAQVKFDTQPSGQMQIVNKWNTNQRAVMLQKNESADATEQKKVRAFISSDGTFQSGNVVLSTTALTAGQFYKIDFTYGASTMKLYVEGTLEATKTGAPASMFNSSESWLIGGYPGGILLHDGVIDEVRIIFAELSGDWLTTEKNNHNDNGTFWGTASSVGGAVQNSNFLAVL